jgi:phenylalanyl-tRNA synthetase alpha chain
MTTPASLDALKQKLDELVAAFHVRMDEARDEQAVRKAYADFGGAQGAVRVAQKDAIKAAPGPEKRAIGELGNRAIADVDAVFATRLAAIADEAKARDLERSVDVTLPGRGRRRGHLHPITLVRRELEEIFAQLGFVVAEGPEVETDFHNFEALAMPKEHPARDMQDTFYIAGPDGRASDVVLRTHTSPVQIRTMLSQKPPVRIVAPGATFRKDDDPTHSPMFHQIEGLCVDEGVSFGDLKGVLLHFVRRLFGDDMRIRLRPSFFPFTEPSAELDMSCVFCRGKGCRTCKGTGWIEIGGAGMVDPEVFRHVGYDSEKYTGFAFGFGIDRMAMLRFGIDDIKHLYDGDERFSVQFEPRVWSP